MFFFLPPFLLHISVKDLVHVGEPYLGSARKDPD